MDQVKNEDSKESIITLQDFPFICRICCSKRSDLRLFEDEKYLLDVFHAIRKIDVSSSFEYPRNICNGCVSKLEDISKFIDISKYNDASLGKNIKLKEEIVEYKDEFECGMLRELIETKEENERIMSIPESQICRICLYPASSLTRLENKMHLMQLFQKITNIVVYSPDKNNVCNKCEEELQKISSFLSSSLCNDQTLENAIITNKAVKTENCSNLINQEMTYESFVDGNEAVDTNTSVESSLLYEGRKKFEIVYIKEEIIDSELATLVKENYLNRMEMGSQIISETGSFKGASFDNALGKISNMCLHLQNLDNEQTQGGRKKERYCKEKISSEGSSRQHMLEGDKPFRCDRCEKSFTLKSGLRKHLLLHTGEKPFKCDFCEASFSMNSSLKRHMLTHTGEKPFECYSCEKSFREKSNLQKHLVIHTGEKLFKCESCEKSFTANSTLRKHLLRHTGERPNQNKIKPYECACCKTSFAEKSTLKWHMLTHTGEKPFQCDCCKTCFSRKNDLKRHMVIHTGEKPFQCDRCEKSFPGKSNLRAHLKTHTGEKPFKCDSCGKYFTKKSSLQVHLLLHTGVKPFECACCKKCFSQKGELKKHMLTHTRGKPFK